MSLASKVDFDHTLAPPSGCDVNAVETNDGGTPTVKQAFGVPRLIGDSGSGGQGGAAPTPAAGDAAAGKFLKADSTWAVPSGTAPTITKTAFTSSSGNFSVAHGLGYNPSAAVILLTSLGVAVWHDTGGGVLWDGTNFYLIGGGTGITGFVLAWR